MTISEETLTRQHSHEQVGGRKIWDLTYDYIVVGIGTAGAVGTSRMGKENDPLAVVDAQLRVIGVDQLRVIDASVMPLITSANTRTPTVMIAEKGSHMIKTFWGEEEQIKANYMK